MPSEIQVPAGLTTDGLLRRRYLARVTDSIAIVLLLRVLTLVWSVVVGGGSNNLMRTFVYSFLLFLGWISYGTILESSKVQATLGKRLMGLRVYNAQGGRLQLMQGQGRPVSCARLDSRCSTSRVAMASRAPCCRASQPRPSGDS